MITGGTKQYKIKRIGVVGATDISHSLLALEALKIHNIEIVNINSELILSNDIIDNNLNDNIKDTIDPNIIPITLTNFELTPTYQYTIKSGTEKRREGRKNDRRNNK